MSAWATRRKTIYLGGVLVCLIVFVGFPLFAKLYTPPSCFDNKQNQGEYGVDCGGPCVKLCSSQFLSPLIVWARALKVTAGVYNLLAYVENPNLSGEAVNAHYVFKVYDKEGVLIGERKGTTFLLPHSTAPVFEGGLTAGQRLPALVTFEFELPLPWEKREYKDPGVVVLEKTLSRETTSPRLEVTLQNRSTDALSRIEVTAIVYDTEDNAMAFSKTFVDGLGDHATEHVVFTWPSKFPKKSSRIEIIPLVIPHE